MNVREILARLNVPNIRFDVGIGGLPSLTPLDVAGAVGMLQGDPLGCDILLALWAPDVGAGYRSMAQILADIRARMVLEYGRLVMASVDAELRLMERRIEVAAVNRPSDELRGELNRAEREAETAKLKTWPKVAEGYAAVVEAVLTEIKLGNLCPVCNGRGQYVHEALTVTCITCNGTGRRGASDRNRADRIRRDESTYRAGWKGPYEWCYSLVSGLEGAAAEELRHRLFAIAEAVRDC